MANLASYQKISRVLPGLPFGDGADGVYSSTSLHTYSREGCSGIAGSTALTTSSVAFSNGHVILIHQSRGANAGQWEINQVVSGGGTSNLILKVPLQFTYIDSGASQAQAAQIRRYSSMNIGSSTWQPADWNQNSCGIYVVACRGTATFANTIDLNGAQGGGGGGTQPGAIGGGYYGGGGNAYTGEGTTGDRIYNQNSANGSGGGSSGASGGDRSGGGGENGGTATGNAGCSGGTGGAPGNTAGSADLTTIVFGGGGGGGHNDNDGDGQAGGGSGGGILMFFCKDMVTTSATISANGGTGGSPNTGNSGAGGGAGGSILVVCNTGTFGTNKLSAALGPGGQANDGRGGQGGYGRIAIHHSGAIVGSTLTPVFTNISDSSLREASFGSYVI